MRWGMKNLVRILLNNGVWWGTVKAQCPVSLPPSSQLLFCVDYTHPAPCIILAPISLHPDSCHRALSCSWQTSVQTTHLTSRWFPSHVVFIIHCSIWHFTFKVTVFYFASQNVSTVRTRTPVHSSLLFSRHPTNRYKNRKQPRSTFRMENFVP